MNAATEEPQMIDTRAAAELLGISPQTLCIWRSKGDLPQPPYTRVGRRAVRYSVAELRRWQAENTIRTQAARPRKQKPKPR